MPPKSLNDDTNPIKDPHKLLQEMDVNRLRAVIYRDLVSLCALFFGLIKDLETNKVLQFKKNCPDKS